MTDTELKCMHEDLETLKRDVATIKQILSEERYLTLEAKSRLEAARKTPIEKYKRL
ncbi:MAG: hypothetical protein AABX04_06180 [Nanoarchaeota archaeon]